MYYIFSSLADSRTHNRTGTVRHSSVLAGRITQHRRSFFLDSPCGDFYDERFHRMRYLLLCCIWKCSIGNGLFGTVWLHLDDHHGPIRQIKVIHWPFCRYTSVINFSYKKNVHLQLVANISSMGQVLFVASTLNRGINYFTMARSEKHL